MKDPQYELYLGDAREVLPTLPEHSVDAIMTSPPYWGLRSYKADSLVWDDSNGGIWKGQLGSEPDPDLFIKHLCDIFDLCKRVLKKTGSLWCNLDDSMAGSGSPGGDFRDGKGGDEYLRPYNRKGIPAKSLCAIPERFVLGMLRRGWVYRQTIIWQKPSTMPESVKDRMTRDFEYLYHFTQQQKYFFERQFEPYQEVSIARLTRAHKSYDPGYPNSNPQTLMDGETLSWEEARAKSSLGRNRRSVWAINPEPQKAVKKGAVAHYAAFPTALCTIPILSTVPEQICTKCGMPRVKVYEIEYKETNRKPPPNRGNVVGHEDTMAGAAAHMTYDGFIPNREREVKEVGLSDCGCHAPFVPGVILDPFAGTGSVAVEARKLGRKAVLIEVSESYAKIIQDRLEKIPLPLGG